MASTVLSPLSLLANRQTSFQHSICRLYTRANIFVTENLPQKICLCGLGLILNNISVEILAIEIPGRNRSLVVKIIALQIILRNATVHIKHNYFSEN